MLRIHKVVSTLPAQLEANAVYAVRTGVGFDLYIADNTGSVAHPINTPRFVTFTDRAAYDAFTPNANQVAFYTGS